MIQESYNRKTVEKLEKLAEEYRNFLVAERVPMRVGYRETGPDCFSPPPDGYAPIVCGQAWGRDFGYAYFAAEAEIPADWDNVFLQKETGGIEGLLFDPAGRPRGMFDVTENPSVFRLHRYVPLPGSCVEGGIARLFVEDYAGHTYFGTMPYDRRQTFDLGRYRERPVFSGIYLVRLRREAEELLDGLCLLLSYYRALRPGGLLQGEFTRRLQRLYANLSAMPQDGYDAENVEAAAKLAGEIAAEFAGKFDRETLPVVWTGHSHLDTAWLWPAHETIRKAARTASNAVRMLKTYPEYRFVMSTALYLEWFERYYPSLFREVIALAKEGRFEINGGAYVECDCNLTGGEALVRQFLFGQGYVRRALGRDSDVFWLPDTFGYSAALPQILLKSNLKYFCTTKLGWNDTNRFPYETFVWQGIDRSRVTAHFNSIQAFPSPACVAERSDAMPNKHFCKSALIAYGYGDGGGGPERSMVESAVRTRRLLGEERVRHGTVSGFMASLNADELPVYAGELYLELHRGTYTGRQEIKRLNRELEQALHALELSEVLTGRGELKKESDELYRTLLFNQFHDILPGTSIAEVNDLAVSQNAAAAARCGALTRELLGGEGLFLNVNGIPFSGPAVLEGEHAGGRVYEGLNGRNTALRFELAGFGTGGAVKPADCGISYERNTVRTPLARVVLDEEGRIVSYCAAGREFVAEGGAFNALKAYEDVPSAWDNWDVDPDYRLKECAPCRAISRETLLSTPHTLVLRTRYAVAERSFLTQDMIFYADTLRVDVDNKLEWRDSHRLVKAFFQPRITANFCRCGIQFGYVERSLTKNTSVEQAQFEVCSQRYTDVSEINAGFSIFGGSKYGVSAGEGELGLTLVKSGTHPDPDGDAGTHFFRYAINPHLNGFSFATVISPAYAFDAPPIPAGREFLPPLALDDPSVIVETVKPAEDGRGVVLRLYESECGRKKVTLRFPRRVRAEETNLLEDALQVLSEDCRSLELEFSPFEIRTLRIV